MMPEATSVVPSVVIVLDVSGSLGTPEALARSEQVVEDLLRAAPDSPVALVTLGGPPRVIADWTTSRGDLIAAMADLGVGGPTPLHDGMTLAASLLSDGPGATDALVVLIADGDDSGGGATLNDAVVALEGVEVWAVAVPTRDTDRERLEVLVGDGGGRVITLDDDDGLAALAARLQPPVPVTTTFPVTTVPVTTTVPVVEQPAATPASASTALLVGGGAAWFVGVALAVAVLWPRPGATSGVGTVAARLSSGAERFLTLVGRRRRLGNLLDAAGVAVRPGEAVMALVTFAAAAGLVAGALASAAVGVLVALVMVLGAFGGLRWKVQRRQRAFAEQLPDLLVSISSALRAGYALSQALDAVARNLDAPAGEELTRVVGEIRLGREPAEALAGMAARTDSRDFAWAVTAMEIHREVGGDLAVIFDTVAHTARERLHLARDVRALTAEGRVSAVVLTALPPGLVVVLSTASPGYLEPLLDGPGPALLGLSAVLMALGWWWMRVLVRSGVRT